MIKLNTYKKYVPYLQKYNTVQHVAHSKFTKINVYI